MIWSLKSTSTFSYLTDNAYECQGKPRVSVSVSGDCDTGKKEGFDKKSENDLSED